MRLLQNRGAMQCSGVFVITAFLLMVTVMLQGASTPAQAQTAPTGLTATVAGPTRIDLSWTRPSDPGAGIGGYRVEVSLDGGTTWDRLTSIYSIGGTATYTSHGSLSLGDTRHYRVCAFNNDLGCGPYSNVDSATTAIVAPVAPTDLTATANGSTQIHLSWIAPAITGGAAISGYKIEVSSGGSTWSDLVADTGTPATTYSHTGLSDGNTRHYRVSAINSVGTGAASNVASATTANTTPGAPTGLTATANGSTRIDLSWTTPAITGGAAISGYKIEVSSNGSTWSGLHADTGTPATTYSHTALFGGDTRHYRVSAINSVGTGSASNVDSATTFSSAPGAPTDLTVTAVRSTQIDLAWTAPAKNGGAPIRSYKIEISSDGGLNWPISFLVVFRSNNVPATFSHTGLALGDTRHYRVFANNSVGTGLASNVASATTATVTPAAPTRLTATAKNGPPRIDLSWTAPADNGGAPISGYKIEVSSDGSTWSDLHADTGTTTTTYSHTALSGGDTRHYRVSAINSVGTGSASKVANATTDIVAPGAPTDLTLTVQPTWVDLSWTAPVNNSGARIRSYWIEVSSDGDFNRSNFHFVFRDGNNVPTTFSHTVNLGLVLGETHYYRVYAVNSVGPGSVSNVVSATPVKVSVMVELTVSLSSVEENAAGTSVTVTGTLDGEARPEATTVTVLVGAATDPASEGTDYARVNNFTLTINAGQTSGTATFTLTPTNDLLGEGDETISVTGTVSGLSVSGTELTITDDEVVSTEVELTVSLSSVEENAAGTSVTVTGSLDGGARTSDTPVTVTVGASGDGAAEGTDYAAVNNFTLTIGTGQTSGTATFTLTPTDDLLGEGSEKVSVTGRTTVSGLSVRGTELTITDDELVSTEVELTVSLRSVAEDAAGTPVTVTGSLDGGARTSDTPVTVTVGASGDGAAEGTDYAAVNDFTLTIDAGQPSGTATFTLTPTDDLLGEGSEKVSVTGRTTVSGLSVSGTELTITDDEVVSTEVELTVSLRSVAEDAAGTPVTVTGSLDGGARTSDTPVTVTVGASGDGAAEGTDYATVNDLTLTIGTGQMSGTATFTLTPTNDTLGEGSEKVSVTGTTTVSGLSVRGTELTITDDEVVSTEVELTVSLRSVAEDAAGTPVTVTGSLDGGARTSDTQVTVTVGAAGDGAAEGTDYATVNDLTLTIGTGKTSGTATFTLTPTNDTLGEGDETISVTGTTTVPGLTVTGTELTITDDDSVSTEVELTVSLSSVEENAAGTSVTVTGTLDRGARPDATTVTVSVGATADSATEGTDYAAVNNFTLTIDAGQTSGTATFTLTPTNDTLGEGGEKVSVMGRTTVSGLSVRGTELTITDDEVVSTEVELTVSLRSVAEDAAGTPVTVTGSLDGGARTSDTQVTVTVGASGDGAAEGTDYAAVNNFTLTIGTGQTSGTATFTLTPTNDTLGEGGEKVSVMGTTTVSGLSVRGTELTITDDEVVSTEVELTVSLRSVAEDAAGTPVTVTGSLDGGARTSDTPVTVTVGASGDGAAEGTDYAAVNNFTLTIDAGQPSGTATFTLTPTNDTLGEGSEKVSVTGTTTVSGLSVRGTELTITDDEVVSTEVELTVSLRSVAEDAAGTPVTVTGSLDGGARTSDTQVTVTVGASGDGAAEGTDYAAVNNFTLTIDAGQTSGTATFTLTPTDDLLGEGGEKVSVTGTTTVSGLSVSGTELTITDDEVVSTEVELTVSLRSVAEDAGGTPVTVTGTLDGGARTSDTQVTVTVGASGDGAAEGTDYAAVNDLTLTIGTGQTSGTATFTLTPTDDLLGEGSEKVSVTGSTTVSGLSVRGTELTITDDELVSTEVELTVSLRSVAEDAGGTPVTVTGTLNGGARTSDTQVTVTVGASGDGAAEGTDYAAVNDLTLTIDAGQTSGTATFTLTPTDDLLGEGGEKVSVTGSTTVSGLSVRGTELTITDDDRASTEVELSVSLRSVAENAAGTPVTVTGTLDGGARTDATTVTVSVGATADSATEGTDYATVNDLTLTIDAGQPSGTATFTLTLTNDTLGEGAEQISVTGRTTVSGLSVSGTELRITDDELVSTEVELSVSLRSVAENAAGTPVTVSGTLDGGARTEATTVTVSVGATADSATEGTDYATVNDFMLTIDAGQPSGDDLTVTNDTAGGGRTRRSRTATFTLTVTNDTLGEGGEKVSVTGTVSGLSVRGTELTITDDDSASTEVELSVSLRWVSENAGGSPVTVTGTLDGGARTEATTVTVSVGATADSATEGTDYATVNDFTLTISAGEPSGTATFTLTVTNDTLGEGAETISVAGRTTVSGLSVSGTELTITDDDSASTEVELSVSLRSVSENAGGSPVTVTGTLDGGARTDATTVTVSVGATADSATEGTDYATVNDFTLTISVGEPSGTATFTLTLTNDTLGEGAEKVSVTGRTTVSGLSVSGTELTITDDDSASTEVELSVSLRSVSENAGGSPVTVTGTLDGGARTVATTVTVSVGATADSATEGTDYATVNDLTLMIDAGQTSGTATFTLTLTNDTLGEGGEQISVTGRTTVSGLSVSGTELTITDDDSASTEVELSVSLRSVSENAAGTPVTVTGTLDGGARTDATTVTVSVGATADSATEGTDYATVNDFTLTISAGEPSGTATFTLTLTNDTLGEGAETVSVTGRTTVSGLSVSGTELTITDDDSASTEVELSVSLRSVAEDAGGTPVTVTGTLDGGARTSATTVTVSVGATADSATEGTDYATVNDLTLTIDAGQPSGTATFTLTLTNDTLGEGDETVSVTGRTTVSGLSVSGTELTIADDDSASTEVELSVSLRSVSENAAGTPVTVTGTLDGGARTDATTVTVSVGATADSATEGTDYATVNDFTLTIDAGQPSGTATFTLTVTNDTLDEGAETVSVTGTTTVSGLSVRGTELTITDDDAGPRGIDLSTLGKTVAEKVLEAVTLSIIGTLKGAPRDSATSVTVSVGAAGDAATKGTDYAVVEDFLLTIPAGQSRGTASFMFTPLNDSIEEPDEAVTVSGTTAGSGIMVAGTTVTIDDDDERGVEVSPRTLTVLEGGASTYTVVLGSEPTGDVTVTVSVGGGSDDVTVSPSGLTFTSSNWGTPRTVTVTAAQDAGAGTATIEHGVLGADYGANNVTAEPVEVTVADGSKTDTISRAWLARFGRTVADQVLEAVEGRMGAVRVAGTELSLAGQRIGNSATPERTEESEAAVRLETLGRWLRGEQEDGDGPLGWRPVTGREVLRGSSFMVTGGSAEGGFGGVWGRGAFSSLDGREGDLRLDGEVTSALLGVDWSRGRGTAGVAVGHSRGEGGYQGPRGDGEVESVLTGVYPYGRYELSEGLSLWGVAGYGAGTFKLRSDGVPADETDTALAMVAVGGRGVVVKPSGGGGLELAMKPDVLVVRTTSEAGGGLVASEAEVTRLRVGLEGTWRGIRIGGGSLVPGFEIGVRHDGGDAESGFGADVGAGFAWRDPVRGIEAELRARGLLTHEDGGFRERGFSGSLAWDPDPDSERGPSLTLIQTVGTFATGGMDALLRPETVVAFGAGNEDGDDLGRRLEARFGYGFAVFGGRYTGTPELGIGLSERGRETSLGWRLAGARREALDFDIRIEASRLQPVNDERDPEHQIGLRMTARW